MKQILSNIFLNIFTKKYYYKKNKGLCLDRCPIETYSIIGSINCSKCNNLINRGRKQGKDWVKCKHYKIIFKTFK